MKHSKSFSIGFLFKEINNYTKALNKMAKINWSKHNLRDKANKGRMLAQPYVGKEHTWTLPGKHTFTRVRDLPLNYLLWASENLQPGEHLEKANNELVRRYSKL